MKKVLIICLLLGIMCGCTGDIKYTRIETSEAQKMMDETKDYIVLDVRTIDEFNEGHIEGAINIPLDEIEQKAKSILVDKNQTIFVYCRSGNRSQSASETLCELGYTNVIEMGGIIDWEGNIVK